MWPVNLFDVLYEDSTSQLWVHTFFGAADAFPHFSQY
jgi:hypothetical protein